MENRKKRFTIYKKAIIIIVSGGATASIAGERKDKHTVDETTTLKRFT